MIYHLRAKFIRICMLSFLTVFIVFFVSIYLFSHIRTNRQVDSLVDIIVENNGHFPEFSQEDMDKMLSDSKDTGILTRESPFSTRFFTVWTDEENTITRTDISFVTSISDENARQLTAAAISCADTRGWVKNYRYKKCPLDTGTMLVFVDGSVPRSMAHNFIITCIVVFAGGTLVVLLLVILFSKYAVKPIAESYEKQKRFITDASHELKTPLTLILTNTEIAQAEAGPNEWLDDIKTEGERMSQLIQKMISLARMDEADSHIEKETFNLSEILLDMLSPYQHAAEQKEIKLISCISPAVTCYGNEESIRQLFSILMDNAIKYCDRGGDIRVSLISHFSFGRKSHPLLLVDNTYLAVKDLRLNLLFDRFYRSDKARTTGEGFGIGLSCAKAIVEKHNGTITAHNLDNTGIRFKIKL